MTDTIRQILALDPPKKNITVEGWVRTARSGKGVAFLEVNDGSCLAGLQLVIDPDVPDFEEIARVGVGAAIRAVGELTESPANASRSRSRSNSADGRRRTPRLSGSAVNPVSTGSAGGARSAGNPSTRPSATSTPGRIPTPAPSTVTSGRHSRISRCNRSGRWRRTVTSRTQGRSARTSFTSPLSRVQMLRPSKPARRASSRDRSVNR